MAQIPTEKFKDPLWILRGYRVNAFVLTENQLVKLSELARRINFELKQEKTISLFIKIKGHTDSTGEELYNLDLGSRRAKYAESQLKRLIGKSKVAFKVKYHSSSEGEKRPISFNSSKKSRFNNRRLELFLEWEIVRVPKKIPEPFPIKSTPPTPPVPAIPDSVKYNECAEFLKFRREFGDTYKKLGILYNATDLHWEFGSTIGLIVTQPKSIVSNLSDNVKKKLFNKVKGPLMEKIFGANTAQLIGAIIAHVKTIQMIGDQVENNKIMLDVEKKRDLHFKLVCALLAGVDLQTSVEWVKHYRGFKKYQRLQILCNEKRGDKGRETQIGLPPSGINQSSNFFDENRRGIKNRGKHIRSIGKA